MSRDQPFKRRSELIFGRARNRRVAELGFCPAAEIRDNRVECLSQSPHHQVLLLELLAIHSLGRRHHLALSYIIPSTDRAYLGKPTPTLRATPPGRGFADPAERHPVTAQTKNTPRASVATAQTRMKEGGFLSHQATMLLKRASPINGRAIPPTMNITASTCNVAGKRELEATDHRATPNMSRITAPAHSPPRVCQRDVKESNLAGAMRPHKPRPLNTTAKPITIKPMSISLSGLFL